MWASVGVLTRQRAGQARTLATAAAAPAAARWLTLAGAGAAGAYISTSDTPRAVAYTATVLPLRLARDVVAAAGMLADYKLSLRGLSGAELEAAKHECHLRGAKRLMDLCFANGGIYIKLGQHIGMLDHLLPAEYVVTMREHMLDRCPVSPLSDVRAVVEGDLGAPLEALFAHFEPQPVASASLAQVHVARGHDGRQLAVKVQHRGLRETSAVDLATIDALVRAARLLAPDFDYSWLVEECQENLPKELDFEHEAANAGRCAANLEAPASRVRGRVAVPEVYPALSSTRVLTMEYIDGVKLTDREGLAALGVHPTALARLVSETFCEQIFVFGDVHCDPHAANLLVRAMPAGAPCRGGGGRCAWQLVLLDHGLYRQLDDGLRLEYAGLWRSLIAADEPGIRRHCTALNAGDAVPLFAGMLTQRPWEEVTKQQSPEQRLALRYTRDERDEIQQYAAQYAQEITALLGTLPRPLLLLLKTNDCLRAVDMALGAPPAATFAVTARECTRALAMDRAQRSPGLRSKLASAADVAAVETRMSLLRLLTWASGMRAWLRPAARAAPAGAELAPAA